MHTNHSECSVALFGTVNSVHTFTTGGNFSRKTFDLETFWIPNKDTHCDSDIQYKPTHCQVMFPDYSQCFNCSTYHLHEHLAVYYTFHIIFRHKKIRLSWTESVQMCNTLGGELPVFNSRGEYEEFVDFLGCSPHLPLTETLFTHSQHKVRHIVQMFLVLNWNRPAEITIFSATTLTGKTCAVV